MFCVMFQVFAGNVDQDTIVSHILKHKIRARFVRVVVLSWYAHITMRLELYGCSPM